MGTDDTARVTQLLQRIDHNTAVSWWTVLWQGLLRGAAFAVGSVAIVALLGWVLALLGVIPRLGDIATYLHTVLRAQSGVH